MDNIENVVEAIIFSSGSPIAKADITSKVPDLTSQKLNGVIKTLQKKYSGDSGVLLLEFNGKYQFTSNPKYGEIVADALTPLKEKELTRTLLEVLSTIAYKQPITRVEIDDMRGGVSSEYAISGLLRANLIQPVGRKDTVGRPLLYGTTDEFLKKFQLSDISELPDYDEVLEQLMLINGPTQETLFHTRSIEDFDEKDDDKNGEGEGGETGGGVELAASDNTQTEDDDFFDDDDEVPDFLEGEDYEVFE